MENGKSVSAREFIDRLWEFLSPDRKDMVTIIIFAMMIGVSSTALPMGTQIFVSNLAYGTLIQPIILVSLFVLMISGISGLLRGLQLWTAEILQRKLFLRFTLDLAYRLPRIDPQKLRSIVGADIVYRYLSLTTVQKAGIYLVLEAIDIFLKTLIGAVILAFYHPVLLAFAILFICAILYIFIGMARGAAMASIKEAKAKVQLASWLEEVSRQQLAFRTSSGRQFAFDRADELTSHYLDSRKETFRIIFGQAAGIFVLQALVGALLLAVGGVLVVKQQLTVGQLVAAELIVTGIVSTLSKFPKHLETFYDLCSALDKLGSLFDMSLESEGGAVLTRTGPASLRVNQLNYESNGQRIIKDICFSVEPGEKVAIVGYNGAGKSVLSNLIYGLTLPTQGSIEIDGIDVRSLKSESLRDHIAVIRGPQLINGTVMANLQFSRERVDVRAAIEAAEKLGLRDAILGLPHGYETELLFSGQPLSANQALLVSVARVLAGVPRLIVLDGTLDALPMKIKDLVLEILFQNTSKCSLLIMTMEDGYIEKMDRTYRLKNGKLEQE